MRRAFDALFGAMIDARARRIFAETFLDWEHEARRATTLGARMVCHSRASISVLRAAAGILVHDLAAVPVNAVWVRVALWLSASYVILYFRSLARSLPPGSTAVDQFTLAALLFPGWIVLAGPLALFLSALWRPRTGHRATPFLGLAILSFVVALISASWVVPAANQEFRETTFALHGGRGTLSKGPAELTLPELLAQDTRWPTPSVQSQISYRLASIVCSPIMVLLASQMQWMRRRYRWVAAPIMLSALGFALDAVARLGTLDTSVMIWGFPIAGLVAAAGIGWVRRGRRAPEGAATTA